VNKAILYGIGAALVAHHFGTGARVYAAVAGQPSPDDRLIVTGVRYGVPAAIGYAVYRFVK
jgi:hypothetical protein